MLPALTPSDRRVAVTILERPEEILQMTVSEVAELADTAASTVVRCCQGLGFGGFHDLKLALAKELGGAGPVAGPVDAGDAPADVLRKVAQADAEALGDLVATVDPKAFDACVDALAAAGRVLVAGVGTSAPVAQDAAYRLMQIGLRAEAPPDVLVQHVTASLLTRGDVCLAVSHSGATRETVAVVAAAGAAGATTVAVTSFERSPLTDVADVRLVAGGQRMSFHLEAMSSRIAHLAIVDALFVALALRDPDRATSAIEASGGALSEHRY